MAITVTTVEFKSHLGMRTLWVFNPRIPSRVHPPYSGSAHSCTGFAWMSGSVLNEEANARRKGKMKTRAKKMRTA